MMLMMFVVMLFMVVLVDVCIAQSPFKVLLPYNPPQSEQRCGQSARTFTVQASREP